MKDLITKELSHKPQTIFDLRETLAIKDQAALIQTVDDMLENYQLVLVDDILYTAQSQGIYSGRISVHPRGFGFLDLEDGESIFIKRSNLKNVYDQDIVAVSLIPNTKDEGEVIAVIERSLETIVGTILTRRKPVKFIADNLKYENEIKVLNADDYKNIHRHKVQLKVAGYGEGFINANIIADLGHADDPGVDIEAILLENGIKMSWDQGVEKELHQLPTQVLETDFKGRKDLRNETIFTIDGEDAKDLDDAISIKKLGSFYELGVHIADVSYYVEAESAIDKEAQKRGTSVYVVDRVVNMLPKALSNGICSLNEGVDRLAVSVIMKINQKGKVVSFDVFPSIIHSKKRMTYEAVNQVLEGQRVKGYESFSKEIQHMDELASILKKKRQHDGAIDFDKDEAKIIVDKKGRPVDIVLRDRGQSQEFIEQFMVCTNEVIAGMFFHSELPALYRIHEQPDGRKMLSFAQLSAIMGYPLKGNLDDVHPKQLQIIMKESADSEQHFVLSMQLLKSMQKARYSEQNMGHFGLSLDEYLHFTSPIRRYPDLIVHRMLRKYIFNHNYNDFEKDQEFVNEFGQITSKAERQAIQAERDVNDMKMAEYMEDFVGEEYQGIISGTLSFGMFVQLENLVEGIVRIEDMPGYYNLSEDGFSLVEERSNKKYRVGDKVLVRVLAANKKTRRVDFELV